MGYLEGLLGGFAGRKYDVEAQNMAEAQAANAREGKVFEALINSPDPEIKAMAVTGLLSSAQPMKRKSGIRGWLGEMQANPMLPQIQALINTPVTTEEPIPGLPSRQTSGFIGTPPGQTSSMALPESTPTTGGAVTAPQPIPSHLETNIVGGPLGVTRSVTRPREVFRSPEAQQLLTKRASAQGDVEGEVAGLIASGFSEQEARDLVKQEYLRRSAAAAGQSYAEGNILPDTSSPTGYSQVLYLRADPRVQQRIPAQPPTFVTQSRGADREAVATRLFGKRYGELQPEEATQVDAEVQKYIQTSAQSRETGTALGKFNAPIDVQTAQATQLPVGTTSAQVAGQAVPTAQQQDRIRLASTIRQQLESIKTKLGVLPRNGDLIGGMLPGAVYSARRIDPRYRTQIADLESTVNNIRASLTRTIQANVGTETEKDAQRALTTLVDLDASLLNPTKGDTQESATVRLQDTITYLDSVLQTLPAQPVPQPVGTPPPSTTPPPRTGAAGTPPPRSAAPPPSATSFKKDAQGNWVISLPNP